MVIQTALNLSSVQAELSEDYFGTLERVAEAGYQNIELVGYNIKTYTRYLDVHPSEMMRDKLKQLGLNIVAAQESGRTDQPIDAHDWEFVCSYYEKLNCRNLAIPSVWISNKEETLRTAEQLNRVGRRMRELGFVFYYHNHAHEFIRDGDYTLYDYLIDHTDPDYVRFELDLGWALRAGYQPVELLEKLSNRCDIVHLKDFNYTPKFPINVFDTLKQHGDKAFDSFMVYREFTAPDDYADLGNGSVDLADLCAYMRKMGHVRYAIVENIGISPEKFGSIANDLAFVKRHLL